MHHIVYLVYIYEVYILQYTFGTKVYTKSTHFCTLFVQYMSCLSALCDLYILHFVYIYILFAYISEVYILQYTFETKLYTKSTHFCTLFVQYMGCLSALCDLYILYTFMKYTFCSVHLELLSTWHPLSNFDLTQLVVTLVSQNIVIS